MERNLLKLTILMCLACSANGSTVIDTFNGLSAGTANGATVSAGNSEGIGFIGGYTQSSSVVTFWTNDVVTLLTNYISGQASTAAHWSVGGSIGSALRRTQCRSTVTLSGSIWFSYLVSLQDTNGDIGVILNARGFDGTGLFSASGQNGFRIGVGFAANLGQGSASSLVGAVGVGPALLASGNPLNANPSLNLITNGVNGAVSAPNVASTSGGGGLVLGHIYTDAGSGFQRIDLWYNVDVTNAASLPAPLLSFTDTNGTLIPTMVTNVAYQVTRNSVHDEYLDDVRLSDETNAFDMVYLNAQLPITSVNVVATQPNGTYVGPTYSVQTNIVFNIMSDRVAVTPINVSYSLSGNAVGGTDYGVSASSLTIPVGQTNVTLTIYPTNTGVPNGDLSVVFTVQSGSGYVAGLNSSAAANILAQNLAGVPVQYMFEGTLAANVFDSNLTASAAGVAGIGGGNSFSGAYAVSPPNSYLVPGTVTTNDEVDAVANGNYMSIVVSPVLGAGMTLTNLQFDAVYGDYLNAQPGAVSAGVVVRSSLDNFSTDLASWVIYSDEITFPDVWTNLTVSLGNPFTNLSGAVEFRIYFYDDSSASQCGVRVDNLYVQGNTFSAPSNVRVSTAATIPNASVATSTSGQFTITRTGDTSTNLTVYYSMSGTASNGIDYGYLSGVATIPAGQTNVSIVVTPLDVGTPQPAKTAILTLSGTSQAYGLLLPYSATVNLAANGDLPGLVVYYFNENNNAASSLASVAAATYTPSVSTKISAANVAAGPGLPTFGPGGTADVGYGTTFAYSSPSTVFVWGGVLTNNESDAIAMGDYLSFSITPLAGYFLSLTNFALEVLNTRSSGAGASSYSFVLRSSVDNYAADIGTANFAVQTGLPFQQWNVPLNVSSNLSGITYRVYVYGDVGNSTNDFVRLDDAVFQGSVVQGPVRPSFTSISAAGGNIQMQFAGDVSLSATNFVLLSATNVVGPYAVDNSAVISGSNGTFTVTTTSAGNQKFFRIGQ